MSCSGWPCWSSFPFVVHGVFITSLSDVSVEDFSGAVWVIGGFQNFTLKKWGKDLQVEKKCSYKFYYTLTVRCLVKLFVFPHLEGRYEPFE